MCFRTSASIRLCFKSVGRKKHGCQMSTLQVAMDIIIEEETLPAYRNRGYYPARIGEILDRRCQIVGKLGYGMSSTVWMCKSLKKPPDYCVVKICTKETSNRIDYGENTEIKMLKRINSLATTHPGVYGVRRLDDFFTIVAEDGSKHVCLVHQPLGISLHELQEYTDGSLSLDILKNTILQILVTLDYLHSEAKIVYTDLQPSNILLGLKEDSILRDYKEAENVSPTTPKDDRRQVVYKSRRLPAIRSTLSLPVIADLGEARDASITYRSEIMPDAYRAPEIIIDVCWDTKVDIWNLGVLSLLEGENLFVGLDSDRELNNYYYLAEMVALLGPAPAHFVMLGELSPKYFNNDGSWKGAINIPPISLEEKEHRLKGEEKTKFLAFLRRVLQWDPAMRPSAEELIYDDFLSDKT